MRTLAAQIAQTLQAQKNAEQSGNSEWVNKHGERLAKLEKVLPSGSGIDNGTKIDRDRSRADRLVFTFGFHHMNEGGYYDGWTEHTAVIEPSFDGLRVRITGRDRNQIKDYLHDVYYHAMTEAPNLD